MWVCHLVFWDTDISDVIESKCRICGNYCSLCLTAHLQFYPISLEIKYSAVRFSPCDVLKFSVFISSGTILLHTLVEVGNYTHLALRQLVSLDREV